MEYKGQRALVTGASSGIGAVFAREFARRGADLVLVARSEGKLAALADELSGSYGVDADIAVADLAKPSAAAELAASLRTRDLQIDILINNAGFGLFAPVYEADHAVLSDMVRLNIETLVDLTREYLPGMLERDRGAIVNVGSTAGFQPVPYMAVYGATKAFVLSFTEALRVELGQHGVRVTVLCPGPVPTEFQTRAGFRPGFDSAVLNVSSADVAQQGYDGLMANKRAVLPGLGIKIVPLLLRLFPRGFILWAVGRFQQRRR
jgi:uncharacterized protein